MPYAETTLGRVHFVESGTGIPLLLLHANPGSHQDYAAVAPALSAYFRVISLDFPGYGQSPALEIPSTASAMRFAEIVQAFVACLALDQVIVMGNSVGGYCALQLAVQQSQRVAGLVLISPGGFTPSTLFSTLFCRIKGNERVTSWIATYFARFYLRQRNSFVQEILARTEQGRHDPACVATDAAVWRSFLDPAHDLRQAARAVSAPTFIVCGKYDPVIRANVDGQNAVHAISGAQLQVLETGHEPFAEAPQLFLDTVLPFLKKVSDASNIPSFARCGRSYC